MGFIGEQGDAVMGMTATEFREMKKTATPDEIRDHLTSMQFTKTHGFIIKAKLDTYNSGGVDESKLRYMALRTLPHDLKEEN
jgi:hypothetical protein